MNVMIVRANSERGAPELPSTVTHVRWGNVQGSKMHGGPSPPHNLRIEDNDTESCNANKQENKLNNRPTQQAGFGCAVTTARRCTSLPHNASHTAAQSTEAAER